MKPDLVVIIVSSIIALLFVSMFSSIIYTSFENQKIREAFCKENGYESQTMNGEYNEGYCFNIGNEAAIKKEFLCEPGNSFTVIGKCKFIQEESK